MQNMSHRPYRMYSPSLDAMMREVLHTLGDIDFAAEVELENVEVSARDPKLKSTSKQDQSRSLGEAPAIRGPAGNAAAATAPPVLRCLKVSTLIGSPARLLHRGSIATGLAPRRADRAGVQAQPARTDTLCLAQAWSLASFTTQTGTRNNDPGSRRAGLPYQSL